jgi:TatD DNase family protein
MIPYINIHTHHLSFDNGVFVFNNRFGYDASYHTEVLFSIGVHPWDAALVKHTYLEELKVLAAHPNCMAIGECGLDTLQGPDMLLQKTVFRLQLELAVECRKPVIIHCVKAFDELMELSKPYVHKVPLIIHGFHKSAQLAAQLIGKGFYLSLNPALFKREDFDFGSIPTNRLFLETDLLENDSIKEVYALAAQRFNVTVDELKERINLNFEHLKFL